MKFVVECPAATAEEIDRAVSEMVNDPHRDDFLEISKWLIKTGLGEEGAKKRLIEELSERISKEISNGMVQITVQELEGETDITAKIEKDLPAFYPRIDFVLMSGAIELDTLTYWFKVMSKVELKNLAVVVKKKEITGINSGTLQGFVTLAFCGRDKENKSPFTLFKNKPIVTVDLNNVVRFGPPKAS
jgi:hypothetical protein